MAAQQISETWIRESQSLRGFACPQIGLDKPFLEYLVVEHARQTVHAFIESYGSCLETHGSGLKAFLTRWRSRDAAYNTVWDLAFGDVSAALLLEQTGDIAWRAGALALRLHQCGSCGEWELHFGNPVRYRFDRWLLPPADAIQVSAAFKTVSVRLRTANAWTRIAFERTNHGWETHGAEALSLVVHPGSRWTVLTDGCLPPGSAARGLAAEVFTVGDVEVDTQTGLLLDTCNIAAGMIANYAPFYAPWVSYVVRDLIPVPARLAVANSASGGHTPGAICIANRPDPCALAEILVHEATHQYLHILTRLGPLDDGTDETLYFSPFRNALRPVYYILVAYHAFANVLLFYSMAQAHGLSVDQYGAGALPRMQRLKDGLEQLERALDATPALTPFGRALWEPLHDQLRRPLGGP